MRTKALKDVHIENAAEGRVSAVFATLGVRDHDGDVIVKGAIPDGQKVAISAYGHGSWKGSLPVGRGVVREVGDEAVFEGQFFMDTTHGRDTFLTVKAMSEADGLDSGLQEWSFSLEDVVADTRDYKDGGTANFITSVAITEVSPVLKGAGINTRTLAVKSGMRFGEHIESVVADVDELVTRAQEVVALRAEKGKTISDDTASALADVVTAAKRLEELLPAADDGESADGGEVVSESTNPNDDIAGEFLRFVALNQGV